MELTIGLIILGFLGGLGAALVAVVLIQSNNEQPCKHENYTVIKQCNDCEETVEEEEDL